MENPYAKKHLVNIERFNKYIDKTNGNDACWEWTGAKDKLGYGRFHVGKSRNSTMLAHRVAYGIETGHEPEAVCHRCDNPSCCNPRHLIGGTRDFNNKDMTRKGRHWLHVDPTRAAKGEQHGSSKLRDRQVVEIRKLYSSGKYTQRGLGSKFGVCQRTIAKIVNGIGWTHVKADER